MSSETARPRSQGADEVRTTEQIFIEEYYTLELIGKAGLATPNMDGTTPMCTACSAAAFKVPSGPTANPAPTLTRRLRRVLPLRPQYGRDPDGAADAGTRPDPQRGATGHRLRGLQEAHSEIGGGHGGYKQDHEFLGYRQSN